MRKLFVLMCTHLQHRDDEFPDHTDIMFAGQQHHCSRQRGAVNERSSVRQVVPSAMYALRLRRLLAADSTARQHALILVLAAWNLFRLPSYPGQMTRLIRLRFITIAKQASPSAFLLLVCILNLSAQSASVTGTVIDPQQAP